MDPVVQKSEEGELIKDYITYYKDPEVGDAYSDFELPNPEGEQIDRFRRIERLYSVRILGVLVRRLQKKTSRIDGAVSGIQGQRF